jgi:dolichyl-phosphate-mannose--protein O-mannosyl transferase
MQDPSAQQQRDPLAWCVLIALGFLALAWHRLGIPTKIYFDEVHYVPAARKLLEMTRANPEHPMVGKEIIAAAIALLGDRPIAWRLPSALFGALGLFAFGRMLWWASLRRFAAIAGMLLLATSFAWFIQSRIAMLDMFMASFGMIALWQFAAALRLPAARARWRLAACGVCLGLALGAKWSFAPAAMLPGLTFLALRLRDHGWRCFTRSDTGPVPGISLVEAAFWLGSVPLIVYWATFVPAFLWQEKPVSPFALIEHHRYMVQLQDSVKKPHPYQSQWYQWIVNWRAIWYLYEVTDGSQRGVLLIGNPFTMLAGLPALLWCLWAGVLRRRYDALALALLYLVSIGLWVVSAKPIQFYYHYLLPGTFLMGCLALALDALWQRRDRWRWLTPAALALAAAMFVWFYPILSSARLHEGRVSYVKWMWLHSWR